MWVAAREGPEARKQAEMIAVKKGEKRPDVDAQLVAVGEGQRQRAVIGTNNPLDVTGIDPN